MSDENLDIEAFTKVWEELTPLQRRFAVAMQEHPTKKEAAGALGISPNTAYNWPDVVGVATDFMTNNIALATLGIIQANATKAAMVKVKGLDNKDDKIAQAVASEILDRNLGKPTQRNEVTGKDGGDLVIKYVNDWRADN